MDQFLSSSAPSSNDPDDPTRKSSCFWCLARRRSSKASHPSTYIPPSKMMFNWRKPAIREYGVQTETPTHLLFTFGTVICIKLYFILMSVHYRLLREIQLLRQPMHEHSEMDDRDTGSNKSIIRNIIVVRQTCRRTSFVTSVPWRSRVDNWVHILNIKGGRDLSPLLLRCKACMMYNIILTSVFKMSQWWWQLRNKTFKFVRFPTVSGNSTKRFDDKSICIIERQTNHRRYFLTETLLTKISIKFKGNTSIREEQFPIEDGTELIL